MVAVPLAWLGLLFWLRKGFITAAQRPTKAGHLKAGLVLICTWPHWSARLQAPLLTGVQSVLLPCQFTSSEDRGWEWQRLSETLSGLLFSL